MKHIILAFFIVLTIPLIASAGSGFHCEDYELNGYEYYTWKIEKNARVLYPGQKVKIELHAGAYFHDLPEKWEKLNYIGSLNAVSDQSEPNVINVITLISIENAGDERYKYREIPFRRISFEITGPEREGYYKFVVCNHPYFTNEDSYGNSKDAYKEFSSQCQDSKYIFGFEVRNNLSELQHSLKLSGYEVGAIDGLYGPETDKAIKHFQLDQSVDPDGVLNKELIDKLGSSNVFRFNYGDTYVLLIGINDYKEHPKLSGPVRDIEEIGNVFSKAYGYKTQKLHDATRDEIITALSNYGDILTSDDNFILYFGGHGLLKEEENEGYWLPVDAERYNPKNWLANARVTKFLRAYKAKHAMIVSDSCYSSKIVRGINRGEKLFTKSHSFYQKISNKRTRTVLTAGGLEPVLDLGGIDGHSVFASALIKVLLENQTILEGDELFIKVRRKVHLKSYQLPEYADLREAGHDGGDFLFIRQK